MTIQIPLLDTLKEIPLYNKTLKEACVKYSGRKKKDPPTIHVLGQLFDLMLSKAMTPKYSDLGSLVVTIHINGIQIQNVLIDLGASINVMTKEVLLRLNIIRLRDTHTILQLANNSTVKPNCMIEDIIVILDSLDIIVTLDSLDIIVPSPRGTLGEYPLTLGRPWMATLDACIPC